MRQIAVVTSGRADLSPLESVVLALEEHPQIGWRWWSLERCRGPEEAVGAAMSCGALLGRPDLVLLLGDRFETLAAAYAATFKGIPIAHIHGGEETRGAMDDAFRHAITKMASLHFAATEQAGRRILQMGEEPSRVHVTGAPGLDRLAGFEPMPRDELAERTSSVCRGPFILCTIHPATRGESPQDLISSVLGALGRIGMPVVFTAPNRDPGYLEIEGAIREWVRTPTLPPAAILANAGTDLYLNLMAHCACMVGNSSSGIIEAPSLVCPVVDVGTRQAGREATLETTRLPANPEAIAMWVNGWIRHKGKLARSPNPYAPHGIGDIGKRIVGILGEVDLDQLRKPKQFVDWGDQ